MLKTAQQDKPRGTWGSTKAIHVLGLGGLL